MGKGDRREQGRCGQHANGWLVATASVGSGPHKKSLVRSLVGPLSQGWLGSDHASKSDRLGEGPNAKSVLDTADFDAEAPQRE